MDQQIFSIDKSSVALVTGASGAIGSEISKKLSKMGCHVVISGRNEKKLQDLKQQIGPKCSIEVCNLENPNNAKQLIVNTIKKLDKIDVLICNAGITQDKLAITMSDEIFSNVLKINLESVFTLNRETIKVMLKKKVKGRIINISSVVAVSGNAGQSNYSASKAGVIAMTKSLAREVSTRGITLNTIAPGFILSDMTNKIPESQKETIKNNIPTKSFGEPKDVAYCVCYLASNEAKYVTGQTIHINGGMVMP